MLRVLIVDDVSVGARRLPANASADVVIHQVTLRRREIRAETSVHEERVIDANDRVMARDPAAVLARRAPGLTVLDPPQRMSLVPLHAVCVVECR